MSRLDNKRELLATVAFLLSMAMIAAALLAVPADQSWILTNKASPDWFTYAWWACSVATLFVLHKSGGLKSNIIGTGICVVLGPVVLGTFGFVWVFKKTGVWE